MMRGLFITGTGTGVGKTHIAALIAQQLRTAGKCVGVYKPVASGCELTEGSLVSPDAVALWEAAGRPKTLNDVCPQSFAAPLAPHLAARVEGRDVDARLLRSGIELWRETSDVVIVEGAGGLMSPLTNREFNADLARDFGYPLVVVAANMLGTINATLQTLIAAEKYGLAVAGVVLNAPCATEHDLSARSNADELARYCRPSVLATVGHGEKFDATVDWWELADTKPGLSSALVLMRNRNE